MGTLVATGDITIADANDGISAVLTADSVTVPADSAGTILSFGGASTTMKVLYGNRDESSLWTFTKVDGSNITSTLSTATITITALTADVGYVDITATRSGYQTLTKRFTVARSKSGSSSTAYWLTASAGAIYKSSSGAFSPSTITFTGMSVTGTNSPAAYAGRFKIYENGSATASYSSAADESSKIYTPSSSSVTSVKAEIYLSGGFVTKLDETLVPVVADGIDGIAAVLSNEAFVFPASIDGTVSSYAGSGTTIRVYQGATELTYDGVGTSNSTWKFTTTPSNITVGTITDSGTYATVGDHTGVAAGTDSSSVLYTITGKTSNGSAFTLTKLQTFTKAKSGTSGTSGLRGSSHFYVSGRTTWDDTVATTAASASGGPVYMDVVTQYGTNFTQTKYNSGSPSAPVWTALAAVLDGSMLVTGSVAATKIDSRGLSIKDSSGNVILAAGQSFINSTNASTYIANGAIQDAQIGGSIQSSDFVTGSAGWKIDKSGAAELNNATFRGNLNVKSATTGARTEITNSVIKVYDASGILRVKMGDLSA